MTPWNLLKFELPYSTRPWWTWFVHVRVFGRCHFLKHDIGGRACPYQSGTAARAHDCTVHPTPRQRSRRPAATELSAERLKSVTSSVDGRQNHTIACCVAHPMSKSSAVEVTCRYSTDQGYPQSLKISWIRAQHRLLLSQTASANFRRQYCCTVFTAFVCMCGKPCMWEQEITWYTTPSIGYDFLQPRSASLCPRRWVLHTS